MKFLAEITVSHARAIGPEEVLEIAVDAISCAEIDVKSYGVFCQGEEVTRVKKVMEFIEKSGCKVTNDGYPVCLGVKYWARSTDGYQREKIDRRAGDDYISQSGTRYVPEELYYKKPKPKKTGSS